MNRKRVYNDGKRFGNEFKNDFQRIVRNESFKAALWPYNSIKFALRKGCSENREELFGTYLRQKWEYMRESKEKRERERENTELANKEMKTEIAHWSRF